MSYINRAGHVSVPAEILAVLEILRPVLNTGGQDYPLVQRAREVDATHRAMQDEAGRSTREQIEQGGGSGPYN